MISAGANLVVAAQAAGIVDAVAVAKPAWGGVTVAAAIEGTLLVAGKQLHVGVAQHHDFPDTLPQVYLLSDVGIPHVDDNNLICAFEREGTLHDHRREDDLVLETIERARREIEKGLLGENHADFVDELEAYWRRGQRVLSVIKADDQARNLCALHDQAELVGVADSATALLNAFPALRGGQPRDGVYLPIDPVKLSKAHPRRFRSWSNVLREITPEATRFLKTVKVDQKGTRTVVLGVPRPSGGHALIGLKLRKFKGRGTLADVHPLETLPFQLRRYDSARVRERLTEARSASRFAVLGCGAVGGHVAHALSWMGPQELVLVDPEVYGGENTFRHALGRDGWGTPSKVKALEGSLERQIPDLKVTPLAKSVADAFKDDSDLLRSMDAIVVAIGDPSVSLRLNDDLAEQRFPVPVIYTWLEPYGIGGHALLVRYGSRGCLRCVFPDAPELHCSIDFAASGQHFVRRELGCSGIYTPYADLDARETALGTARLVERALQAPTTLPWLRSWRGDATAFLAARFRLAERYEELPRGLDGQIAARTGCSACDT